jgi:hypothetical protein
LRAPCTLADRVLTVADHGRYCRVSVLYRFLVPTNSVTRTHYFRWSRSIVAAATWGSLLLAGDMRAFATCGDYLSVEGLSAANLPHATPADDPTRNIGDRGPTGPCRGPHCRSHPESPSQSPPVPPPTTTSDHWGLALPLVGDEHLDRTGRSAAPGCTCSLFLSDPPFRPPRGT